MKRRKLRVLPPAAATAASAQPPAGSPGQTGADPAVLSTDSHRIEAFSDAVFGFAATLLVVTLEVPRTYPQLMQSLWGFIPFALSFLALSLMWTTHRAFFRRYHLADRVTIGLNSVLLFVILFYVYPLKFMTVSLIEEVILRRSFADVRMFRGPDDVAGMFVVYGMGFAAVFACFALMYAHAARQAVPLGLDAARLHEARALTRHYCIMAGVGLISALLAAGDVAVRWGLPGFAYFLIGPFSWWHGVWSARRAPA